MKVHRLTSQGMYNFPGNNTPMVGPAARLQADYEKRATKEPCGHLIVDALLQMDRDTRGPNDVLFDARKYPMIAYHLLGQVVTIVSDPLVAQDIFVS